MRFMNPAPLTRFARVSLACALVTVAATACGGLNDGDYSGHDINTNHPIEVSSESVSIVIGVPMGQRADLSPDDARRLKTFIRDFVERGRTAIVVETQMGDTARAFLESQGLRANEIHVVADTTLKAPNAALSFTANTVKAPECGDFSRSSAYNPRNQPSSNFGCSNRRNMGLTVADPGDLIDHQPVSSGSAARRDSVLDSYSAGEPIGPAPAPIDTRSVAGAGGG